MHGFKSAPIGRKFPVIGHLIGALLIGVLLNGLVLMNVSSHIQQIIIGVIIVLAAAFDTFAKSRRRKA
jgi:inositol transport system permease protein